MTAGLCGKKSSEDGTKFASGPLWRSTIVCIVAGMATDYITLKSGKHPNVFEYTFEYISKRLRKGAPVVECVNQQNIKVEPLDPLKPFLRFNQLENKLAAFIFVVVVALADGQYMPLILKVWVLSVASMVYLVYYDYARIPIRYVHPSLVQKSRTAQPTSDEAITARLTALNEEQVIKEHISVSQCEFHILQVKVIDRNDGITNAGLTAPVTGSRAVFQITVICGRSRWEVWRKYEHFCKVYDNLCTKYANHKIAKLPSLDRIKKTWKNFGSMSSSAPENTSSSSSNANGSNGVNDATVEDEEGDDVIFLGHAFLQKLQAEMLGWLRTMQLDPIGDDASLRALLKLPAYKAHPATGGFSTPSTMGRGKTFAPDTDDGSSPYPATTAPAVHTTPAGKYSVPPVPVRAAPASIPTAVATSASTATAAAAVLDNNTAAASTDTATAVAGTSTSTSASTSSVGGVVPNPDYVSPCGCYKGNTVETFQWIDLEPRAKDMYIDIRYTHDFKLRSGTYLSDKKKCDAGPSMSRLMLMENIHVNTARYGERLDHICAIGRVKRRIEIMHALPGNPFVIVLNLQIPGDPPVSIVFYFLVPTTFYPGRSPSDGLDGARELFRKFIDIPLTPVVQETEECLSEIMGTNLNRGSSGELGDSERHSSDDASDKRASFQRAATSIGANSGSDVGGSLQRSQTTVGGKSASAKPALSKAKSAFYVASTAKSWTSEVTWPDMSKPHPGVLARDSFQNKRFKLIPAMVEAPWVVQMAVSSTPVLLGQKVVQRYWRGEGYMEIDVHVGSSAIADNIVGVCRSYAKAFICNLGIVIQGESEDELPEQVLACGALKYIDVDRHSPLETFDF